MDELITSIKPTIITGSSRIVQESVFAEGNSHYGVLRGFLGVGMEHIDQISHFLSGWTSDVAIRAVQNKYYHDDEHKVRSFLRRNVYMSKENQQKMAAQSQLVGTFTQLGTEAVIQLGARGIQAWMNKRDQYKIFEQMYTVLTLFLQEAEKGSDITLAKSELDKIRNSFPLSVGEKKKLKKSVNLEKSLEKLDFSLLFVKENAPFRNATAYFLMSLQKQLYKKDANVNNHTLANYYSFLDMNGVLGKNMMIENGVAYDEIAVDQVSYLQISRGIAKKLVQQMPDIDIGQILARNEEAKKIDPYSVHRGKIQKASIGGTAMIAGIFTQNPMLFECGLATALSQFTQDERLIDVAQQQCKIWGIAANDIDSMLPEAVSEAEIIHTECINNDGNTSDTAT